MRQEKGWIEDFYKFVQEQNYSSSASCGPLAQIILDFFDFESGKQEFLLQHSRVLQCTFETKQKFCITVLGLSVALKLFMLMIRTVYLLHLREMQTQTCVLELVTSKTFLNNQHTV